MHIELYEFGRVVIDGKSYKNDVLICGDKIVDWWRKRGHFLQVEDLDSVWISKPEILIIGQGAYGEMDIDDKVIKKCSIMDIKLVYGKTAEIASKFNNKKGTESYACGLHLTC